MLCGAGDSPGGLVGIPGLWAARSVNETRPGKDEVWLQTEVTGAVPGTQLAPIRVAPVKPRPDAGITPPVPSVRLLAATERVQPGSPASELVTTICWAEGRLPAGKVAEVWR